MQSSEDTLTILPGCCCLSSLPGDWLIAHAAAPIELQLHSAQVCNLLGCSGVCSCITVSTPLSIPMSECSDCACASLLGPACPTPQALWKPCMSHSSLQPNHCSGIVLTFPAIGLAMKGWHLRHTGWRSAAWVCTAANKQKESAQSWPTLP